MVDLTPMLIESIIGVGVGAIAYVLYSLNSKIKDLWEWHAKEDDEGVKIWYTRNRTMEETLDRLTDICERMDRREDRALIIQNETIKMMQGHTTAITKLVAVVEALTIITKKNGR